jgi:hypothetical protein
LVAVNLNVASGTVTTAGSVLTNDGAGNASWQAPTKSNGGSCVETPTVVNNAIVYQNTTNNKLIVIARNTSQGDDGTNYYGVAGSIGVTSNTLNQVVYNNNGYSVTFVVPPGYYYEVSDSDTAAAWQICEGGSGGSGTKTYSAVGTDNISIASNAEASTCTSNFNYDCYNPPSGNTWDDMGAGGTSPLSVTVQNSSATAATYVITFNASINKNTFLQFRFLEDGNPIAYTAPMDLDEGTNSGSGSVAGNNLYAVMYGGLVNFTYPVTISDTNKHVISVQWSATNNGSGGTSYQYGSLWPRSLTVVGGN